MQQISLLHGGPLPASEIDGMAARCDDERSRLTPAPAR
jgi:hypothetical protein